jgi:hypothetical protein
MNHLLDKYSNYLSLDEVDTNTYGWVTVFVQQDGDIVDIPPNPLADNPDDLYGYTEVQWNEVAVLIEDEDGVKYITENKAEIDEIMNDLTPAEDKIYAERVVDLLKGVQDIPDYGLDDYMEGANYEY